MEYSSEKDFGAKIPVKRSQVEEQTLRLENNSKTLLELSATLEKALSKVLLDEPVTNEEPNPQQYIVPLANELRIRNDELEISIRNLTSIKSRLEL